MGKMMMMRTIPCLRLMEERNRSAGRKDRILCDLCVPSIQTSSICQIKIPTYTLIMTPRYLPMGISFGGCLLSVPEYAG
jgi:hypothetical protein